MSNRNLKLALYFRKKGWSIIPIHSIQNGMCTCRKEDCPKPGKHPRIKSWRDYQKRKPTKIEIEKWWTNWPEANIAIITGSISGLLVVDADGEDGRKSYEHLKEEYNLLETLKVITGNGFHTYYQYNENMKISNSVGKVGKGIDIRTDGGYVITHGSMHASGHEYHFEDEDIEISKIPSAFLETLQGGRVKPKKVIKKPKNTVWQSPQRKYARIALDKACLIIADAKEGTRNDKLNEQAFSMAHLIAAGTLNKREVRASLIEAALYAGLDIEEAKATIQSGFRAGMEHPRDLSHVINTGVLIKSLETVTASDLLRKEFDPSKWAVENLLPEGLTIIAGRPKIGKSWFVLDCALSVAIGTTVLTRFKGYQGQVLYLALEDNEKRLKNRLVKLLNNDHMIDNLFFSCEIAKYDESGLEMLQEWLDEHPDCRLIIIDTMRRYMKAQKPGGDTYGFDTENLGGLQQFAQERGIAIVVVHHTRKSESADPMDEVLGSTGLTGVADAILVLKKDPKSSKAILHTTGRDFENEEINLTFDSEQCRWLLDEKELTENRQQILFFLEKEGVPCTPKEISEATNQKHENVKKLLKRMLNDQLLELESKGRYCIPSSPKPEESQLDSVLGKGHSNNSKLPISLNKFNGERGKNNYQCIPITKRSDNKGFIHPRDIGNEYIELDLSRIKAVY